MISAMRCALCLVVFASACLSSPDEGSGGSGQFREQTIRIADPDDTAEEAVDGSVSTLSTDLELMREEDDTEQRIVGLRFVGVNLSSGARVEGAHIQFTADKEGADPTFLTITAESSVSPAVFVDSTAGTLSTRDKTEASVDWAVDEWLNEFDSYEEQRTPDLSAVITEVIDLPGWQSGGAIVIFIDGDEMEDVGQRIAISGDQPGEESLAPALHLSYRD